MQGDKIRVLGFREAVLARPVMYLGTDTPEDFTTALVELAIADALSERPVSGQLNVEIRVIDDYVLTCADNGPGLPVEKMTKDRPPLLTELFTTGLIPGPPRGHQLAIIAVFCSRVEVTSDRDGVRYRQSFEGSQESRLLVDGPVSTHGSRIVWRFEPDRVGHVAIPRNIQDLVANAGGSDSSITVVDERTRDHE